MEKGLFAALLYGSGLRLMECLQLRIQDVDFTARQITVRVEQLGHKDVKTTMMYTHVFNRGPTGVRSPMDWME
ncbi:hypothetical protein ACFL3H_08600 [Gemmatimonadota bacterium]